MPFISIYKRKKTDVEGIDILKQLPYVIYILTNFLDWFCIINAQDPASVTVISDCVDVAREFSQVTVPFGKCLTCCFYNIYTFT